MMAVPEIKLIERLMKPVKMLTGCLLIGKYELWLGGFELFLNKITELFHRFGKRIS